MLGSRKNTRKMLGWLFFFLVFKGQRYQRLIVECRTKWRVLSRKMSALRILEFPGGEKGKKRRERKKEKDFD